MPNPLPPNPSTDHLIIEGARQSNLKSISLEIPHDTVTAITGVSGFGQFSLVCNGICAVFLPPHFNDPPSPLRFHKSRFA